MEDAKGNEVAAVEVAAEESRVLSAYGEQMAARVADQVAARIAAIVEQGAPAIVERIDAIDDALDALALKLGGLIELSDRIADFLTAEAGMLHHEAAPIVDVVPVGGSMINPGSRMISDVQCPNTGCGTMLNADGACPRCSPSLG